MQVAFDNLKAKLKAKVSEGTFQVWLEPLKCGRVNGKTLVIKCPNKFFGQYIKDNFLHLIQEEIKSTGKWDGVSLDFSNNEKIVREQLHLPHFSPEEIKRLNFHKNFTFEEFVVGESNHFAHSLCLAAAGGDVSLGRPLYIASGTGLGKSHLSQAVGQAVLKKSPNSRICYLSANAFTSFIVNHVKNGDGDAIKKRFEEECDLLLLEDIHTLSGRERTQAELAYAIDAMVQRGKKLIFTGNAVPIQLSRITEQLNSRLESSVIATINPPDFPTRKKIIQRKAEGHSIQIDGQVVDFLAEHLRGDIRKIEGAVIGLVSKSSLLKQKIDLAMAKDLIDQMGGEPPDVSVVQIKNLICRTYNVSKTDLKSRSRKKAVAQARQAAMYLSRKFTEDTLESIGLAFGRNHATVLHAIKQIAFRMDESRKFKSQMEHLMDLLEKMRWQG